MERQFINFIKDYKAADRLNKKKLIESFITYDTFMHPKRQDSSRIKKISDGVIHTHIFLPIKKLYMDLHNEQELEHFFIIFF